MTRLFLPALLLAVALLSGCGILSHDQWVPSPNFNARRPNFVIIHQTDSANHERALQNLTSPIKNVSAHYLIAKDGRITQLVEERNRAWHAGKSYWGGQTDMNSASIGIELDHQGDLPFEAAQIDALLKLLRQIGDRHGIPAANHLGHGDIAPARKVDHNRHFPWKLLAAHGFGVWCEKHEAKTFANLTDPLLGLQALGYDTGQPDAAGKAFRRHFRGDDSSPTLDDEDLRMLACLLTKKTAP